MGDIAVAPEVSGSLSAEESVKLGRLESVIEANLAGFKKTGIALLEIRDARLYRAQFSTFEEYCRERWAMNRAHANRLIAAAEVAAHLDPMGSKPDNERQIRPLVGLPPEQQREVWQRAVETAPEGRVTARHVAEVVEAATGGDDEGDELPSKSEKDWPVSIVLTMNHSDVPAIRRELIALGFTGTSRKMRLRKRRSNP